MAYITLNKNNFFHNLDIIAQRTKSKDKIAIVVKDNAYGHGLVEIAQMAKEYGITKAVVKSYDEASKIENYFEYILVLADFPEVENEKNRYTINDLESITKFPRSTKVELKVDTGMHRNGVAMDELEDALELIEKKGLNLEAVFTHHRSADELSSEWYWQNENFKKVKQILKEKGYANIRFHSANSASLFRCKEFNEDMARVGIAIYGCLELPNSFGETGLKPVLSLHAKKISSRKLQKGQAVGYGATHYMQADGVVGNYDFGYGDGFLRTSSNNFTTPDNYQLVGRVSMDNSSFTTDEDEILIFNDARKMAKSAGTISYEVLTSLKKKLKRKIL